jgi:hypothetical protein
LGEDRVEVGVHPLDREAETAGHLLDEIGVEPDDVAGSVEVLERRIRDVGTDGQHALHLGGALRRCRSRGRGVTGRRLGRALVVATSTGDEREYEDQPQQSACTHVLQLLNVRSAQSSCALGEGTGHM